MKKLIWSAFAVSLFTFSICASAQSDDVRDFLGLEEEVLPDLTGTQKFTSERLHDTPEWRVRADEVEIDKEPLKGQNYSILPWSDSTPEDFLDINVWMRERKIKDQEPDWKSRVRDQRHVEVMGKLLNCQGKCKIWRGLKYHDASFRSKLYEGDEFEVGENSYAWIYLMDGSLARVASDSAVNFQEINIGQGKNFVLLRLNRGHLFWSPKEHDKLKVDSSPETDGGSLPLSVLEANVEHFERLRYQSTKSDVAHLFEVSKLDDEAIADQFKMINSLREENSKYKTTSTQAMIVAPNVTVVSTNTSFDLITLLGGKSYVKKRSTREGEDLALQLRGYINTDSMQLTEENWTEISETGREKSTLSDVPAHLQVLELLTKRVKTMELARELWFKQLTAPVFDLTEDAKKLGIDRGYVLWEKGMPERFQFLSEFTRRMETTNLRAIENLLKKSGQTQRPESLLSENTYRSALNDYLMGLKARYTQKKIEVKEMTDLQYYVWALKHGKFKN